MTEEGFKKNSEMLSSLVEQSLEIARGIVLTLSKDTHRLSLELDSVSKILLTLDFIQKNGSIEAARLSAGSDFSQLFASILGVLKDSKMIYSELSDLVNKVIKKEVTEAIREYEVISTQWRGRELAVLQA